MAVPNEATQNLPSDLAGRYHHGLWDQAGGVYRAQRGTPAGHATAVLYGVDGNPLIPNAAALTDSAANPTTALVGAAGLRYNGATWDRERGNTEGVLLPSAARTASVSSANLVTYNARSLAITVDVTTASGTGGLTCYVQSLNPVNGVPVSIFSGAVGVATGAKIFTLGPGCVTAAVPGTAITLGINMVLPRTIVIYMYHADGSAYTYSVGYSLGS